MPFQSESDSRHEARRTRRLQAGCLSSRSRSTQTVADPLLAMNRALPPAGGERQGRDIRGSCSAGTNILWSDAFCPRLRDDSPAGHAPSVLGLACRQASEDQLADTAAPIPRIAIHRPGAESPQGCQGELARSLSYLRDRAGLVLWSRTIFSIGIAHGGAQFPSGHEGPRGGDYVLVQFSDTTTFKPHQYSCDIL